MNYSPELQNKIATYYEKYYQSCGLKDFKKRAQERLREEELELARMKSLQEVLNKKFERGQKHFIVGAGTGGLAVVLAREYGCDVYGIEPDKEQFEIIREKCRQAGVNPKNFKQEFGENISFSAEKFDFLHCFTVLEHVQKIEKCIQEMIRVTKPGGVIYINTPNYRFPLERHYKIFFPTFLPKPFGYFYLFLRGKPIKFLKSINFITQSQISKILARQEGIYWLRIYRPLERKKEGLKHLFLNFLKFHLFIYPNQEIVIKKLI